MSMAKKQSLLWEIYQNDLLKGYLFGTMHVSGKVAFSNFETIYSLIDNCQLFATEVPLDKDTQMEMGRHMFLPSNSTIKDLISEKKFVKYSEQLAKHFNVELDLFNKVMPLYLINLITQKSLFEEDELLNVSMDYECWKYAEAKGLLMSSVESLDDHIDTLYSIPIDYQLKALKSALKNLPLFRKKARKMMKQYKSQDIHKLYASSKKSLGEIKEVLLYKRNIIMTENILKSINTHKGFFAFGAGHLAGKYGVISLLRQNGCKIKASAVALQVT